MRPQPTDYPAYAANYVNQTTGNDVLEIINASFDPLEDFLIDIPEEKADYAYAPGKWTLKEVLQHMIDTERIFAYRALCIARGEKQNLPGFEENEYAASSFAAEREWDELIDEMLAVRSTTIQLFSSFTPAVLNSAAGTTNQSHITLNALGFIIIGHVLHHFNVISERYLS